MQQADLMLSMFTSMVQTQPLPQPGEAQPAPQGSEFSKLMKEQRDTLRQETPDKPAADKPEAADPSQDAEQETLEPARQMALAALFLQPRPVIQMEQVVTEEAQPVAVLPLAEAAPEAVLTQEVTTAEAGLADLTAAPLTADAPEESFGQQLVQSASVAPEAAAEQDTAEIPVRAPEQAEADRPAAEQALEREAKVVDTAAVDPTEESDAPEQPAEAPVFRELPGTPVKVAEAPAAERPREIPEAETQLAKPILTAMENGDTRLAIQLNPESLGKVTVELTAAADGGLAIVLTAESSHTAGLLSRSVNQLMQMLGNQSGQPVTVEVQQPEQSGPDNAFYDGRDGAGQGEGFKEQQQRQKDAQHKRDMERRREADFLHQIRLGLI